DAGHRRLRAGGRARRPRPRLRPGRRPAGGPAVSGGAAGARTGHPVPAVLPRDDTERHRRAARDLADARVPAAERLLRPAAGRTAVRGVLTGAAGYGRGTAAVRTGMSPIRRRGVTPGRGWGTGGPGRPRVPRAPPAAGAPSVPRPGSGRRRCGV